MHCTCAHSKCSGYALCLLTRRTIGFWKVISICIDIKSTYVQVLSEVTGTQNPFHHLWWHLQMCSKSISFCPCVSVERDQIISDYHHSPPYNTVTCKALLSAPSGWHFLSIGFWSWRLTSLNYLLCFYWLYSNIYLWMEHRTANIRNECHLM